MRSSAEAIFGLHKRGHIAESEEINEAGITPDQIQSFSYSTAFGVTLSVFYEDLNGQYELADFECSGATTADSRSLATTTLLDVSTLLSGC